MIHKKWIGWTAVLLWIGLIFFLTSQTAVDSAQLSRGVTSVILEVLEKMGMDSPISVSRLNNLLRKVAHFFVFMVLGILVMFALSTEKKRSNREDLIVAFVFCVVLAIIDETRQLFVPGRGAMVSDVLLDSAGALMGIGLWLVFFGKRREESH